MSCNLLKQYGPLRSEHVLISDCYDRFVATYLHVWNGRGQFRLVF
jgi:hypothetical protein